MDDEFKSPALWSLNQALWKSLPDFTKTKLSKVHEEFDINSIKQIGTFSVQCIPEGEHRNASEELFETAMQILESLEQEYPKERKRLYLLAHALLFTSFSMALGNGLALHKQQAKQMGQLIKKNQAAASNRSVAQKLAADMWALDESQLIRTTEMADKVYRAMAKMDLEKPLPDTLERVKQWIRPVAPEHAKRRGPSKQT